MWITRDKDGSLWLSTKKPIKESIQWIGGSHIFRIQSDAFPVVKWEDEEPRELILK